MRKTLQCAAILALTNDNYMTDNRDVKVRRQNIKDTFKLVFFT